MDNSTRERPRPEKVAVVDEVQERFESANAVLLTEYRGLSVKSQGELRRSLRSAGGDYKVYKNTLVRIAAERVGLGDLEVLLHGPTAIAFVTGDAVEVAKSLRDFAKTHPTLVVKGGVLGTRLIDAASASALADMPPRTQVLAEIAGLLEAPLAQFAALLAAPARDIAYALQALIDKHGGEPVPEVSTEDAAA